jgi:hypothetical protein
MIQSMVMKDQTFTVWVEMFTYVSNLGMGGRTLSGSGNIQNSHGSGSKPLILGVAS